MFADPQSVTINGTATSLPRVGNGPSSAGYQSVDGLVRELVSHQDGKRFRRLIKLSQDKISADALVPSQNSRSSMSVQLVIDHPKNGFTNAEVKYLVDALLAQLSATSGALITKVIGGES